MVKKAVIISLLSVFTVTSFSSVYGAAYLGQSDYKDITIDKSTLYTENFVNNEGISLDGVKVTPYAVSGTSLKTSAPLPSNYSLVDLGYVSPIKNQGSLGVCWAFSALSVLESKLLQTGNGLYDFSEEHLNHLSTIKPDGNGWQRDYTEGGYSLCAMGYLTSWRGPVLEKQVPYRSADNKSYSQVASLGTPAVGVTGIMYLNDDIQTVKQALYTYGAVSATYNQNSRYDNSTRTAYYQPMAINAAEGYSGHGITIVGWDDNYSKTNFNSQYRPNNNGAWLVKNSWGDYNSLHGYFWISYEDYYLLGNTFTPSFVITDVETNLSNKMMYQNETDGAIYDLKLKYTRNGETKSIDNMTFINVFNFSDKYDTLSEVVFETQSIGAQYTAYYIPMAGTSPDSNKANWVAIGSGTVSYSGYINLKTNFDLPLGNGAIGITIDADDNSTNACSMGCDEWLKNTSSDKYIYKNNPEPNKSFFIYNGTMTELNTFYKDILSDNMGSTFVIKAIADAPYGSVTGGSRLRLRDVADVQKYVNDRIEFTAFQKKQADVNCDGGISLADAFILQRALSEG